MLYVLKAVESVCDIACLPLNPICYQLQAICQGKKSSISYWTVQYHYTVSRNIISSQCLFSSITSCQSSSRVVFYTEPLTCHSGHWCPINENSAGNPPTPTLRDYGEKQEPSLSHLGCSSLRKTAIVTTSPPQAALHHSMISNRLICLFQTTAGILMGTFRPF